MPQTNLFVILHKTAGHIGFVVCAKGKKNGQKEENS